MQAINLNATGCNYYAKLSANYKLLIFNILYSSSLS